MADPNPPGAPNVDSIIGPIILGQAAAIMLFGVLLSEFNAFVHSPGWRRSSRTMKCVTTAIMLTVAGYIGLAVHDIFYYGTLSTSDIGFILQGTVPSAIEPIVVGVVAFTVQIILLLRVLKILPHVLLRWAFATAVAVGSLFGLVGACMYAAIAVKVFKLEFDNWPWRWDAWFGMWLCSVAAVDVLLTSVYIWALCVRLKGGTQLRQSVLRLLVVAAVRTAAYTAVLAVAAAVLGEIWRLDDPYTNIICYAFWEPLPPLYALSLFTTLTVADNVVARLGDPALRKSENSQAIVARFPDEEAAATHQLTGPHMSGILSKTAIESNWGLGGLDGGMLTSGGTFSGGGAAARGVKADGSGFKPTGSSKGEACSWARPHSGVLVQIETVQHDERDYVV